MPAFYFTKMETTILYYNGGSAWFNLSGSQINWLASLALLAFNIPFSINNIAIGSGLFLLFAAFIFPLFHLFKAGYITTVVLISFLFLTYISGHIVSFINENLTVITDYIFSLSTQILYMGAAAVIITFYAVSWGVTTFIYQRKAF